MATEAEARTQLERMVANTTPPTLSTAEVSDLLKLAERLDPAGILVSSETEWAATTAVALGDVRVPTLRTGRRYQVTTAGTTGGSEPTWPTTAGGTVVDGTVTWTLLASGAWIPTFDLAFAATEGWRWKAARLSDRFAFGDASMRYDRQQAFEHALKMADYYAALIGQYPGASGGSTIPLPIPPTTVVNDQEYGIQFRTWDGSGEIPKIN